MTWLFLPGAIIAIAVATLVVSSFQKEAGIAQPGKGGRAAVAAVAEAQAAASGSGAEAYDAFSKALTVAAAETSNIATSNPAETRLVIYVNSTMDCLKAEREAWQAELDQEWDPAVDGDSANWLLLHPALQPPAQPSGMSVAQVRGWAAAGAAYWLQKTLALVQ